MRKVIAICVMLIASVGSVDAQKKSAKGVLKDIFNKVSDVTSTIVDYRLTPKSLEGTWSYVGSACMFESDELLKKAGGAAAAAKITDKLDSQLALIGVKEGGLTYTFRADTTFTSKTGKFLSVGGKYVLDGDNDKIELQYRIASFRFMTVNATIRRKGKNIELLFPAHKLLTVLQMAGKINTTTSKAIGALAEQYDGLMLGYELKKQ
ncbi:MAG: DUF4923 family protein [Rikenellaceae bacterium]|nr:DUF4923 family protein [Rikenellaceae bacterium]